MDFVLRLMLCLVIVGAIELHQVSCKDTYANRRHKRAIVDFANVLSAVTGDSWLSLLSKYEGYGCYCGSSLLSDQTGTPEAIDGIDACCKLHDECWISLEYDDSHWEYWWGIPYNYVWDYCSGYASGYTYTVNGGPPPSVSCPSTGNNACERGLCECDSAFAICIMSASYNPDKPSC